MTSPADTPAPVAPAGDPTDADDPSRTEPAAPAADRPTADVVALAVAACLPLVGVVLALVGGTWLTVAIILLTPLVLVAYGLGLWVFARVLRRASPVRRMYDGVPRRYRVYAWLWALAFLAAGASPLLGGLDGPWQSQVAGVVAASVLVGVLTVRVWLTYVTDLNAEPVAED